MIGHFKKWIDWSAIGIGLFTMAFLLFMPQNKVQILSEVLCFILGLLGLLLIIYAAHLWFWRRIDFDWHLINGHFLRKVICLVLLIPFTLTTLTTTINYLIEPICATPKELVYDDKLYESKDNNLDFRKDSQIENPTMFWAIYYHYIDAGNQHMTSTKMGRAFAALIAILGIFMLNGLLVSSIIGWIERRKERWHNGEVRYKLKHLKKNQFAVVIGANEAAVSVLKNLLKGKEKGTINFNCEGYNQYVILQTNRNVQDIRSELASHLSEKELRQVILYHAARDSKPEIAHLYIEHSTEIYILGESTLTNGGESFHDTMNMKCANLIAEYLEGVKNYTDKRVCKVMFEYQTTYSVFQFSDISETMKRNLVFIPFSRYESWARKVIVEGHFNSEYGEQKTIHYTPLEGFGLHKSSDEFVHLVIVGMSKMGIAMGVQCLLQAHYLNYQKARTRITFIDANADQEMDFFTGRYANIFELIRHRYIDTNEKDGIQFADTPWKDPMNGKSSKWAYLSDNGSNFLDVEIEFVKGKLESQGVREYLKHISNNDKAKLTFAICLTQAHQAVAASLYMPIEVYKNHRLQEIWVYQRESTDIISNLNNESNKDLRYKKLRPFGMLHGEYMADRMLYLKAMLINVAYDIANGYNNAQWPENLTDKNDKGYTHARKSWKNLSVDKKWSNKYFADSIYIKIRNLLIGENDFSSMLNIRERIRNNKEETIEKIRKVFMENEELLAQSEHNRWTIQQLLMGYSPCDKELDNIFRQRNAEGESDAVKKAYAAWKQTQLGDASFCRKIKDDVKECPLRIHPNICGFNHLEEIDSGAQQYDKDLNNAIATILSLVDAMK